MTTHSSGKIPRMKEPGRLQTSWWARVAKSQDTTEQLRTHIQRCWSFRVWLANWCWLLSGDLASSLLDVTILTAWQLAPSKVNNPKEQGRDFPGGPGVKNLPAKAGDMGLILGLGTKILHASGQLSLCTTSIEPLYYGAQAPQLLNPWVPITETRCLEPVLCNKTNHCNEKPAHHN